MALDLRAATKFFLDRGGVERRVGAGQLRVLSKFGAFVRRGARQSIRTGKGSAAPGRPPKSHRGDLKRLIFFGVDPTTRSTVIGPVIFDNAKKQSRRAQEALEYGGPVVVPPAVGRSGETRPAKVRTYRGNPFMGPAFARELTNPKLAPLLSNSIR